MRSFAHLAGSGRRVRPRRQYQLRLREIFTFDLLPRIDRFHVPIAQKQFIRCDQCQIHHARSRDENAIGRIVMKAARKIVSLPRNFMRDIECGAFQFPERVRLPDGKSLLEAEQSTRNQPRDLEGRDR